MARERRGTWREGFSQTSIGRFGGFREDVIPYNSGYLTANAMFTRMYLNDGDATQELGWYQLPPDFSQKTRTSWVSNQYTFRRADGKPHSVLTRSLLFPGFHYTVHTGVFEYYFRIRGYGPSVMAMPLRGGVRQIKATDGYDCKEHGRLAKPWILLYWCDAWMPFDYPMLITFDKQPVRIELIAHEYLKVHFAGKDATVVQIHPFGAERLDKTRTRAWRDAWPSDLEEKFDLLSRAALAYPYQCKESFLIDEERGVVRILNEFKYLDAKSDWGVEPLFLAPLPPVVANLHNFGYPVAVKGEVLERICPTFSGWYEAVRGKEVEYELPLSRFRNLTLAPVAIGNNPLADKVTAKLTAYLESGDYMTFGGDDDYDPACPLDSLHDLRIMAWALHSIPEAKRQASLRQLTRGLAAFGPKAYYRYKAPGTGTPWARDKTIFANLGVVDYDFEWYNGMNLAGLWAYSYFGGGKEADRLIRKHWPLIKEVFGYVKAYSDWAQLACWTCCRGEATWLDGINYTYQGVLGYAALARKLGDCDEAEWADYSAARLEAFICNSWLAGKYYAEHFPQGDAEPLCAGGYWEGRPTGYSDETDWSCGVYAYCVPELMVLFKDLKLENGIRRSFDGLSRKYPNWQKAPYSYGKAKGYPGTDERRTIHHYFLDPRLMVSTVVLGNDVRALLDSGAPLTGPVLECCLISMAPRLLVPRDAEFLGATWDDASKTLTVRLAGSGVKTLAFAHSGRPRVMRGKSIEEKVCDGRVIHRVHVDGPTELVFKWDA